MWRKTIPTNKVCFHLSLIRFVIFVNFTQSKVYEDYMYKPFCGPVTLVSLFCGEDLISSSIVIILASCCSVLLQFFPAK